MIELLWNGPISEAKMSKIINVLTLTSQQRVLDVGCGCGEVLIRLHEQYGISGLGIDSSPDHIAEANRRLTTQRHNTRIKFEKLDATNFHVDPKSFDLVICLGATHAFGLGADAFDNALKNMLLMVVPGGKILVADGYLKQPADPEYRERFLGDTTPDTMTHRSNVTSGIQQGLIPLAAWTSSNDEWDDFEWSYQRHIERHAAESPNDDELQQRLKNRREWMEGYLTWGRDTLGYGIYLFQKPAKLTSKEAE